MIYKILLVKIDHRIQEASLVQSVLTEYGCNIKVRLGLHEVSKDYCAQDGMIVLQVEGDKADVDAMLLKLNKIEYVTAALHEM